MSTQLKLYVYVCMKIYVNMYVCVASNKGYTCIYVMQVCTVCIYVCMYGMYVCT